VVKVTIYGTLNLLSILSLQQERKESSRTSPYSP